jgi:hypothetical protein
MEFYVKLDASDAVWKPLILIKYDEADFILKKTHILPFVVFTKLSDVASIFVGFPASRSLVVCA